MKKKIIGIFLSMLLILTVLPASGTEFTEKSYTLASLDGKTLYVGGDGPGNYTNIQDAIDNATDGDTIFVYNGTYGLAHNIIYIYKSVSLIGENKLNTIINGSSIRVNVSEVLISDFTIQNSSVTVMMFSNNTPSINNISINNNIIKNYIGIMMFFCNNSIVTNNSFFNSGLILWGYQNEVYNNTVNDKPLVYLESTTDEVIDDAGQVILTDCTNVTINNLELSKIDMGIQLYECTNCNIKSNVLSSNGFGIFIANSNSNIISGNILLNNWFGLLLTVGENNNISGNHFENGAMNVGLADTNNNLFLKNNFIFSKDNYIFPDNDFLFKLIFNRLKSIVSIESDNIWNGNYWNRPRILPVLIWGNKVIKLFRYRNKLCLDVDWHPAQEPYDI